MITFHVKLIKESRTDKTNPG